MRSILQAGMRASAKVNCNFLVREDRMFRPEVINIYSDGNRDIGTHFVKSKRVLSASDMLSKR